MKKEMIKIPANIKYLTEREKFIEEFGKPFELPNGILNKEISLFAVVMFASIFGTLVPMTLEKLKVDPAIATGPFISITNDIIGMMLYMGITVLLS